MEIRAHTNLLSELFEFPALPGDAGRRGEAAAGEAAGSMLISADSTSLIEIWFAPSAARIEAAIRRRPAAPETHDAPARAVLAATRRQLEEYFRGERREFDLPLAPRGTDFQRQVWQALIEIPYGETRSYLDVARAIGRPAACRAVGHANGSNPIPIVIPCHRVIGSNGALTGFGGGLPLKRRLLELEGAGTSSGGSPRSRLTRAAPQLPLPL